MIRVSAVILQFPTKKVKVKPLSLLRCMNCDKAPREGMRTRCISFTQLMFLCHTCAASRSVVRRCMKTVRVREAGQVQR